MGMSTTVRKSSAERRAEILAAVLEIIGTRGIAALSTSAIAGSVGLSSGALFRHFASLDEILVETARHAVGRLEETFPDPSLPPLERITSLARNRVRTFGSDDGLAWLVRSDQAALRLPGEAVEMLERIVDRSRRFILEALAAGAADGSIRADIPPDVLIVPVMGTIHAAIGMTGVHGRATRSRAERVIDALSLLLKRQDS